MLNKTVVIVGAGLSGLLTALELRKNGIRVQILEARDRIGGRIYTAKDEDGSLLEMGATWFGPQHVNLRRLIEELELPFFQQYMDENAWYDDSSLGRAELLEIPKQAPSYRITGGTSSLINEVAKKLDEAAIHLNEPVKAIHFVQGKVEVEGRTSRFLADKVVCCLPPALLAKTVKFSPSLPGDFREVALSTHTWMQEAIKTGIVYKKPFWREKKISAVFSNNGPVTEFYDHANQEESGWALCGFLHPACTSWPKEERQKSVIEQLERLYGTEAKNFLRYEEMVWTEEKYTTTSASNDLLPHQNSGHPAYENDLYEEKLIISGSETSPIYGGYMEGAVVAASRAAKKVLNSL